MAVDQRCEELVHFAARIHIARTMRRDSLPRTCQRGALRALPCLGQQLRSSATVGSCCHMELRRELVIRSRSDVFFAIRTTHR